MKFSPLDSSHRRAGARFTEFGGWDMPLNYRSGTVHEHHQCRKDAVVFDVSHLGTVELTGSAFENIQKSLSNDLSKIEPGRAQYTHLLNTHGGVLDDIIIWWLEHDEFVLLPNATNTSGVLDVIGGRDVTAERALLAVQGPMSRSRVVSCLGSEVWAPRFTVRRVEIRGVECIVAGTGYTGEVGIEMSIPLDLAEYVWDKLVNAGVEPAGLGARDTLRLEAALPLHGHELGPEISPLQAGLDWVIGWDKNEFIGRGALLEERERGVDSVLRGIATEGRRPPRADATVECDGRVIGRVSSGNFSPTLGHGIALAFLEPTCLIGDEVELDVRGTKIPGQIVETPFVSRGREGISRDSV